MVHNLKWHGSVALKYVVRHRHELKKNEKIFNTNTIKKRKNLISILQLSLVDVRTKVKLNKFFKIQINSYQNGTDGRVLPPGEGTARGHIRQLLKYIGMANFHR